MRKSNCQLSTVHFTLSDNLQLTVVNSQFYLIEGLRHFSQSEKICAMKRAFLASNLATKAAAKRRFYQ